MKSSKKGKIRHSIITILALTLGITALIQAPAGAQVDERERGFYAGLKFVGSSLHVDDDGDGVFFIKDDGGGMQLAVGYSFNEVFSLEMDLGGALHETSVQAIDATIGMFQLFAHYRFMPGHAFRPYVKGGLGGYSLELKNNVASLTAEGGGIPIGGGFDYFFSKHFSLGVDLTHNIIKYDEIIFGLGDATVGFDMDEEGSATTMGLALTGYF